MFCVLKNVVSYTELIKSFKLTVKIIKITKAYELKKSSYAKQTIHSPLKY